MERTLGEIFLSVLGVLGSLGIIVFMFIGLAHVLRPRPHDTRMNTQQMIYSSWARWLDHKERRESLYIEQASQLAQPAQLAEPVKPKQLPMPELIEGVIVYSEAQKNAIVKFAQERAMSIYKQP